MTTTIDPNNPPRHKFWGAGEPDCPRDLKASNGELHTMRCKVCGDGWRKSTDVCFGAADATGGEQPAPAADEREAFITAFRERMPLWQFQDDGTGGFHNQCTDWAWIGWQARVSAPAPAGDAPPTDAQLLDLLAENSWDLRCFDIPTGAGDADIGWAVVGHFMGAPKEREMGVAYSNDPREALRAAHAFYVGGGSLYGAPEYCRAASPTVPGDAPKGADQP